jgi:hypothetical protein
MGGDFYNSSMSLLWNSTFFFVKDEKAEKILENVHDGVRGSPHKNGRTLAKDHEARFLLDNSGEKLPSVHEKVQWSL